MYRVVIAEDETTTRKWLVNKIAWSELGLEVACAAENGRVAWECIQERQDVDIVITDIRMPQMDGLELVRNIRALRGDQIEVVILTGYDEFQYAREALQHQVHDYLLKPVLKETVADTMGRIIEKLKSRDRTMNRLLYTKQLEQEAENRDRAAFFERLLLHHEQGLIQSAEWKRFYGPDEGLPSYLFVMEMENYAALASQLDRSDLKLCYFIVHNIFHEVGMQYGKAQCVKLTSNRFVVMLSTDAAYDDSMLRDIGRRFQQSLRMYLRVFDVRISIGISPVYLTGAEICQAYERAEKALYYRYFTGLESVSLYEVSQERDQKLIYPIEQEQKLVNAFKRGKKEEGAAVFEQIMQEIGLRASVPVIHYLLGEMLARLYRELRIVKSLPVMSSEMEELLREFDSSRTFEETKHKARERLQFIQQTIDVEGGSMGPIARGIEYMKTSLSRDLSLQEVSEHVGISPSYFSGLFKQEAGVNFIDYIARLRMERSVELLERTNLTVAAVGEQVGYASYRYFTKVFKDYYGTTPSQYRMQITERDQHDSSS